MHNAIPVLPESAPFSPEQRAWLNGFLAGMLNVDAGAASVYGQQTITQVVNGASTASTSTAVAEAGLEVEEEYPWHDPALPLDERLKLADGKPQPRRLMAAMAQLDCGACGYICKSYAEAIANGEEKDLARCTPGGKPTSRMLKQLIAEAPVVAAQKLMPISEVGIKRAASASWDRNNPFPSRLVRCVNLNKEGSSKDTRLVVLDLKSSGLTYKPGDALGVYPENCPDLVQDVLEALHASGAEDVQGWDNEPASLRDALIREYTITRPTPDLIDLMSRSATDPTEAEALKAMRDDEEGPGELHVVELLHKFPSARLEPANFLATLAPLSPRLYSIASSLAAHPGQVHLTVGTVRYQGAAGRNHKGVASTFLADRLRPGQKVRVFVHPSHKFGLPAGDRPVIMVGPGTGIAPFRSFLQERAATGAKGRNWLFFGDQRGESDFLYQDELGQYLKDGVLTRLDTAFSRDQAEKIYVQTRMQQNGADLWKWLQDGASFYVCGDAKRMALDVDRALRLVIAEHGKLAAADVDKYVAELVRSGRYQRDVY